MAGVYSRKRSLYSSSSDSSMAGPSAKKKRQFIRSTFDKWQREHDRKLQTLTWLRCNLESDKVHVANLCCSVCKKYEKSICSLKNFSSSWITGSTNLKLSNMLDHANSDVHKAAMTKLRADTARGRGESAVVSTPIGRLLSTLDQATVDRLKYKFDVCYTMAKENMPFSKYPPLLELAAHHGANVGPAYNTPDSAKIFTSCIAKSLRQSFLNKLSDTHFFSFLTDGSTDAGNQEDELVVLVYCSFNNVTEELTSCTRYLTVENPDRATAVGLFKCVGEALKIMGIDSWDQDSVLQVANIPVLVGGGSDGASVNVAECNGLKGMVQRSLPWVFIGLGAMHIV